MMDAISPPVEIVTDENTPSWIDVLFEHEYGIDHDDALLSKDTEHMERCAEIDSDLSDGDDDTGKFMKIPRFESGINIV